MVYIKNKLKFRNKIEKHHSRYIPFADLGKWGCTFNIKKELR